nr:nadh-ubiquinone oxidoreductase 9.5 kda subunit [Quercus suber]
MPRLSCDNGCSQLYCSPQLSSTGQTTKEPHPRLSQTQLPSASRAVRTLFSRSRSAIAYPIMAPVHFWSNPVSYVQWAARAKPAILWSIVVGSMGPVILVVAPPVRRYFGDGPRPQIPLTYPIPKGPRQIPEGYDD